MRMKAHHLFALLCFVVPTSALAAPANYWECILDRMPKATTDQEAGAIRRQCRWDFTDFYWRRALPKDEGFGPFTTKASECIEKQVAAAKTRVAKNLIREACVGNFPQ